METPSEVLEHIPIDYFKAVIKGYSAKHFTDNTNLDFIRSVKDRGGEILLSYAIYRGMKIKIYESGRITIQGSLHKYWNYGEHNYNDFTKTGFLNSVKHILEILEIEQGDLYLTCMEIAVNIIPPIPTDLILNNIFMHKEKEVEQQMSNDKAKFHSINRLDFQIKFYDKALQYGLAHPLLRIEIKYHDWGAFREAGIITLEDFIKCNKAWFRDDLIRCWNQVLFFDPTVELPTKWNHLSNPNFWKQKRKEVKEKKLSRAGYLHHVKKLEQLNTTGQNIQQKIAFLIDEKALECSNT